MKKIFYSFKGLPSSLFLGPDCNSLDDVIEFYGYDGGYNVWGPE
jgi:hypothetical protein